MRRVIGYVEDDAPSSQPCCHFCQLPDGDIGLFVGDIVGFAVLPLQQQVEKCRRTVDHIGPRAERLAFTLEHNVLSAHHIADKLRIDAVVRLGETRTIDVRGARDAHADVVLCAVTYAQSLSRPLCRRVAGAHLQGVDIAAVAVFEEWPSVAFSIDFARRDIHKAAQSVADAIAKEVVHADKIGAHHAHGVFFVEPWGCSARRIDDEIEVLTAGKGLREVHGNEAEPLRPGVAGKPFVRPCSASTRRYDPARRVGSHQQVGDRAANEPRRARHEDGFAVQQVPREAERGGFSDVLVVQGHFSHASLEV